MDSVEGLEAHAEYDLVVPKRVAQEVLGDSWVQFLTRNRLDGDQDPIYLEKVKKEADREALLPYSRKLYTGWFEIGELPSDVAKEVLARRRGEDLLTQWDMISFDEMNEVCAACKLSWDKGRGCIGTFGPENSLLPEIADKYGCTIVSGIPRMVERGQRLSPKEAERLLDEIALLREKLPEEGKMMTRRYGGVLDRLEEMATVCIEYGTRFYFI